MLKRASDQDRLLRNELIERATALVPLLRRNAEQTDRERRVVDENIGALQQAGMFRLLVPRRYGGHQIGMRANLDIVSILAEGCGASAWVVNLINNCAWFIGLMPTRTQDEIFGTDPDARAAGVFAPSAQTQRVDGGLIASGRWYWASGSLHANWAMLGLIEHSPNGKLVDQYLAFAPMDQLTIEQTWYASGMRGTGSNCLIAENVFIPDHHMISLPAAVSGKYLTEHTEETLYRSAFAPVIALILAGPQLGLARAAQKHVIEMATQRNIPYTIYERQVDSPAFQLQIASAAMQIDSAHLHAYRAADDIDNAAANGAYLDYATRARVRADAGYVARMVTEAISTLLSAHGAGSFAEANPLQRIWRDANTAARHAFVLPPVCEELYGKVLLGVDKNITPLI
ncbi:MAG: acyl-CoA dehydrogenase family protein [Rudaea sp.]